MTTARIKFKFSIFAFSIGYIGGLRWWWGLKTHFKIFLKGIFVQEGSSGIRFDHGKFEIKTFPIYTLPYCIYYLPQPAVDFCPSAAPNMHVINPLKKLKVALIRRLTTGVTLVTGFEYGGAGSLIFTKASDFSTKMYCT